jgi:hypothetical protein
MAIELSVGIVWAGGLGEYMCCVAMLLRAYRRSLPQLQPADVCAAGANDCQAAVRKQGPSEGVLYGGALYGGALYGSCSTSITCSDVRTMHTYQTDSPLVSYGLHGIDSSQQPLFCSKRT